MEKGTSADGEAEVFFPSTFYATHAVNDRLSAGLGIFSPFGLGTSWPDDWPGRYITTDSQITTFDINPVISWRLLPRVAVAAGADLLLLDARLENKINSALLLGLPSGSADSGQKLTGDGHGWGYNLGLLVDLSEHLSFGAAYRSAIKVDIDGDVSYDRASPLLAEALPDTGASTSLTMPQQLTAGLAWRASDRLTVEAGLRWEDWSSFDELRLHFERPVLGQSVSVQPRHWQDTFAYNIGARYRLNDTISLLAGYLYSENPVPDTTFEPAIPDSNNHTFSLGTEIGRNRFRFALAYALLIQEDRVKRNATGDPLAAAAPGTPPGTVNGTYQSRTHLIAASLRYLF